ncbi:hypothetical protein SXCC_00931 [Gluconacetobacter sp. SXCC-1]|nr:hypothetical protein SXCC_00931 [Gluconacetobacter sp. SXCC-1]
MPRASRIDHRIKSRPPGRVTERGLCQGGAADIAHAHEQYGNGGSHRFPTHETSRKSEKIFGKAFFKKLWKNAAFLEKGGTQKLLSFFIS